MWEIEELTVELHSRDVILPVIDVGFSQGLF